MLKFLFSLMSTTWRQRILGFVAAGAAAFVGVKNDIDEDKTNDTNWEEQGVLILLGIGISGARPNNVTSESAGATK